MKRRKFFLCAVTCYNLLMSLLLLYVIATSLAFTCEHVFGTAIPAGSMWVFSVVGLVFACKTFISRMTKMTRIADRLSIESNKAIISTVIIIAVGVIIFLTLAWAWIKIYPHF